MIYHIKKTLKDKKILRLLWKVWIFICIVIVLKLISLNYSTEYTLAPFPVKIEGLPNIEIRDIVGGDNEDIFVLASNNMVYQIDLDHHKVISSFRLSSSINPSKMAYFGSFYFLDNINKNTSIITLYNNTYLGKKFLQYVIPVDVVDIIAVTEDDLRMTDTDYESRMGNFFLNISVLTKENKLYQFKANSNEKIEEIKKLVFRDDERVKEEYKILSKSFNTNFKTIYYEHNEIKLNKIPNAVHGIYYKYMIVAYKGEKGLSFNTIDERYTFYYLDKILYSDITIWFLILLPFWTLLKKRIYLGVIVLLAIEYIPLYLWISCNLHRHESTLHTIISPLAIKVQEKFVEKNRENSYYLNHPTSDAYEKYNYLTKEEILNLINQTFGCTPKKNEYREYTSKCRTKSTLFTIKVDENFGDDIHVSIDKEKSSCSIRFRNRRLMDFKDKIEGKNAGYKMSCSSRACIRWEH